LPAVSQLPANVELCACPSPKKIAGSQKQRLFVFSKIRRKNLGPRWSGLRMH
jgi:hypothetical protein